MRWDRPTAEQVAEAAGVEPEEEAHVRLFIKRMEEIREERKDLNDRKADAKAALMEHAPGIDFTALMIAYNIYVASETEQEAGATMKHTAATIEKLSRIWAQPTLFDYMTRQSRVVHRRVTLEVHEVRALQACHAPGCGEGGERRIPSVPDMSVVRRFHGMERREGEGTGAEGAVSAW